MLFQVRFVHGFVHGLFYEKYNIKEKKNDLVKKTAHTKRCVFRVITSTAHC